MGTLDLASGPQDVTVLPADDAAAPQEFLAGIAINALLLLPAVLTVALSFSAGSFFPGPTALTAVMLVITGACCLLLARRPFAGLSVPGLVVSGALAGFAALTLISAHWSHAPGRALLSYDRVLIYALTFVIFASIRRTPERVRIMLYGLAAGVVVVCVAALVSRMLPHVIASGANADPARLSYPLTYWNSLGLLSGIGLIFCGHLACSSKDPWPVRVLGAAAAPLVATTLFLTFSRGAAWATVAGVLVYLLVARPPGVLLAALSTLPPWIVALTTVNPPSALLNHPGAPATIARGQHQATVLLGCALAAGLIRTVLLPLDNRLARVRVSRHTQRVVAGTVLSLVVVALVGIVASGVGGRTVNKELSQFQHGSVSGGGFSRLLSASSNGRDDLWTVALHTFEAAPFHGTGAGTYEIDWNRQRSTTMVVVNAHNLYLETLAELGWVGMLLLGIALAGSLAALARLARGPNRALHGALLAGAVTWLLAVVVDWEWQMPAVTLWPFAAGGLALAVSYESRPTPSRLRSWARWPALAACGALVLAPLGVVKAEPHIKQAVAAADRGNCATALPAARVAERTFSTVPQPAMVIAYCTYGSKHPAAAVAALQQALRKDPNNWELWYDLGALRLAQRRPARTQLLKAARLNPRDPHSAATMVYLRTGPLHRLERTHARVQHEMATLTNVPLADLTPQQTQNLRALHTRVTSAAEAINEMLFRRHVALTSLTPLVP